MSQQDIPENLKYTQEHEWVRVEDDGTVTVGITHFAQQELGEVVFVDFPDLDADETFGKDDECLTVESVKAVSEVYCPVAGQITAVNTELNDKPELVNESPYEEGWLFKLQPTDPKELDTLLSANEYQNITADA